MYWINAGNASRFYRSDFDLALPVPGKTPNRNPYVRYDWEGMKVRAYETGAIPEPIVLYDKSRKRLFANVMKVVETGDYKALLAMRIGNNKSNSSTKMIAKFRDVCVIALKARERLAMPASEV